MSGLPPQLAEHLVESDDSTLALYARDVGLEVIKDSRRHFVDLIQDLPEEEYVTQVDTFSFFLRRICGLLAEEFDYGFYLDDLDFLESFPPLERHRIMILRMNIWQMEVVPELTREMKIDSVHAYHDRMVEYGDRFGVGSAKIVLSKLYGPIGDNDKGKWFILDASKDFADMGMHGLTCQSLGVLGTIYEREGKVDSMEMCYQRARDLAIRYGLSDQISRFSYFYARRYARMGRLALANDLFNEAIELCKTYKGGYYEIRFLFHAMEFYAEYSCWQTVERLLARARILEKVYENSRYSEQFVLGNKYIEARWHMANGRIEKANGLYNEIEDTVDINKHMVNYYTRLYYWARGLIEHGLTSDAIEIVDQGLSKARQESLIREEVRFIALKASAEFNSGNIEGAREAIERFDAISPEIIDPLLRDGITLYVIRARIALSDGDNTRALALVEEGLHRLRSFMELMDVSVQGYLWISECTELRRLMHELTAHDPKLGYGAELFWQGLPLNMGTRESDPNTSYALLTTMTKGSGVTSHTYSGGSLVDYFGVLAERAISYTRELGATHCLYTVDDNHTIRFTVSRGEIRREKIQCTRQELRGLIAGAQGHITGEQNEGARGDSRHIHDNLSELGRLLLPDELFVDANQGDHPMLMITTDDLLSRIPFEVYDTGAGEEYVPLLEKFDIVYLRHLGTGSAAHRSDNPSMIVVNSQPGAQLRNRYSFGPELRYVQEEGRAIAAMHEDAIIIQGLEVTKREIKKRWEHVSHLYFATHIIRDPEIPYLVLIPLSVPDGDTSPESGFLDFTDIRSADFSGCEVVVLSGCSSGAPSVFTRYIGPSLGDAFLDAGAAVVIATFWDVKDEEARKLMTLYAREPGTTDRAHIRSLCNARRKLLEEEPESSISFDWASYAIHVGRLPN